VSEVNRIVDISDYRYAIENPVGNVGQLIHSSSEYIYVRGGGVYYFYVSDVIEPVLRTSRYEVYEQYVDPLHINSVDFTTNKVTIRESIAKKVDLDEVHQGRNNESDKIVKTNGSGYLDVGYINSNTPVEDVAVRNVIIDNGDGYYRKRSLEGFKSDLGIVQESGTWTPVLALSSPPNSIAGYRDCTFVRTGSVVFIKGVFSVSQNFNRDASFAVAGLPFVPSGAQSIGGMILRDLAPAPSAYFYLSGGQIWISPNFTDYADRGGNNFEEVFANSTEIIIDGFYFI
jgi:hypothetical protein